jgi:hypothetical protein
MQWSGLEALLCIESSRRERQRESVAKTESYRTARGMTAREMGEVQELGRDDCLIWETRLHAKGRESKGNLARWKGKGEKDDQPPWLPHFLAGLAGRRCAWVGPDHKNN